ncbi:MAG: ferritin-like domain-containing protein [candidate division Zixibacteria bacterium]|nr:ferritin-like domain-containing protein [candidate division Zixibacteria bacterium]
MSKDLNDSLNQAIAREIAVSIQYMWQHVMGEGIESPGVLEVFKKIAIVEMKHAEAIAERLDFLGGIPTTKPDDIKIGGSLQKMIKDDIMAEKDAIKLYRDIIALANKETDIVTRKLFEDILVDEEGHLAEFQTLLGKK